MLLFDSVLADARYGWRRLAKNKITSAAAILSLALAIGACTSAFRLIDALLLRPLPVAEPGRLYSLSRAMTGFDGKPSVYDSWAYPSFRLMRAAVKDQAELIAVSYAERTDLTYASDDEMEKAYTQYVSGWMFSALGLQPAVGRLFTEKDDLQPGVHPYAVLSHDYWSRRFGQDRKIIGRTFHLGNGIYEIIGVARAPFTGTETGTVTDIFISAMMNAAVERSDSTWIRAFVQVKPGVSSAAIEPLRGRLQAVSNAFERDRAKGFTGLPKSGVDRFLNQTTLLQPAAAGISGLQQEYRRSLIALGVLVGLVLLIACANVANLMTAQSIARAREMALRVSVGAGRFHLVQLVLLETAWLALLAAILGSLFAWWSAPFVASGLARIRLQHRSHSRRGVSPRSGARAPLLCGQTRQRAQGRGRPAFTPPPDACADCHAGRLLFPDTIRRRSLCCYFPALVAAAHWLFRRTPSQFGDAHSRPSAAYLLEPGGGASALGTGC
jgi:predicted permease